MLSDRDEIDLISVDERGINGTSRVLLSVDERVAADIVDVVKS